MNAEHAKSVESFISSQSRSKDDYLRQIEDLKSEVERLKTEKMFLSNEVQDVSMRMRMSRSKKATGAAEMGTETSPNATPSPSPVKKRARVDLEASFRDGFDDPRRSPSRRRKRQEVIRQMGNNRIIGTSRLSPFKGIRDDDIEMIEMLDDDGYRGDTNGMEIENIIGSPAYPNISPIKYVNRSTLTSPEKRGSPEKRPVHTSSTSNQNVSSQYIKSNSDIEFYRIITSHIIPGNTLNTIELLRDVEYKGSTSSTDPTDKSHTISSYLLESFFSAHDSDVVQFIVRCLDVLSTPSLTQSHPLILYLLEIAYTFDPTKVFIEHAHTLLTATITLLMKLIKTGLPEIPKISKLPSTKETPWFKTITIPSDSSLKVSIMLCAMDVLETITICSSLDNTAFKTCWSLLTFDFIKDILLSPTQYELSTNILVKALRILMPSISDSLLGPVADADNVETKAKLQLEQESLILNTLVRYLFQKFDASSPVLLFTGLETDHQHHQHHQPITPTLVQSFFPRKGIDTGRKKNEDINYELYLLNNQNTTDLHQLVIQFFTSVALRRDVNVLIDKCHIIPNLAQAISYQLDFVYDTPDQSKTDGRVDFISNSVRLFHCIWSLYEDPTYLTRSLFGDSGYENIVAMARIALSEYPDSSNPSISVRFQPDVIDRAHDILEQCITLAEADEIYLSMFAT